MGQAGGKPRKSTRYLPNDDSVFDSPQVGGAHSVGAAGAASAGDSNGESDGSASAAAAHDVDTTLVGIPAGQNGSFVSDRVETLEDAAVSASGRARRNVILALVAVACGVAIAVLVFLALSNEDAEVTIQYETDGGSPVAEVRVEKNGQVTSPLNPAKPGYTFAGWYADRECTQPMEFPVQVTRNMVVYAKWEDKSAVATSGEVAKMLNREILPDSDDRYLSREDLQSLSDDDLSLAMNEIWARHHRLFDNKWLQSYFDSMAWYEGSVSSADFLSSYTPTDIENKNAELMIAVLRERGYDVNRAHPN